MDKVFDKNIYLYLQKSIALFLIFVILINISLNILIRPKKAEAFGWGSVGDFLTEVAKFAWDVIKEARKLAYQMAKDIWQEKLTNRQWWVEKLSIAALETSEMFVATYLDQAVNDLTGWIEGEKGKPHYIKNYKDYLGKATGAASAQFLISISDGKFCKPLQGPIQSVWGTIEQKGKPFTVEEFHTKTQCTLGEIEQNLDNFFENFEGGWDAWLKITEPQNNIYGLSLMIGEQQIAMATAAEEEARQKYQAGQGWADTEACTEWINANHNHEFIRNLPLASALPGVESEIVDYKDDKWFALHSLFYHTLDDVWTKNPAIVFGRDCKSQKDCENLNNIYLKEEERNKISSCMADPKTIINGTLEPFLFWLLGMKTETGIKEFPIQGGEGFGLKLLLEDIIGIQNIEACKADPRKCSLEDDKDQCLIEAFGYVCTKSEILTPGSAVGKLVSNAWEKAAEKNLNAAIANLPFSEEGKQKVSEMSEAAKQKAEKYATAIATATTNRIVQFGAGAAKWTADTIQNKYRESQGLPPLGEEEWLGDPCANPMLSTTAQEICREYQDTKTSYATGIDDIIGGSAQKGKYDTVVMVQKNIETKKKQLSELNKFSNAKAADNTSKILDKLKELTTCQWQACVKVELEMLTGYDADADADAIKQVCINDYCDSDGCNDEENKYCKYVCCHEQDDPDKLCNDANDGNNDNKGRFAANPATCVKNCQDGLCQLEANRIENITEEQVQLVGGDCAMDKTKRNWWKLLVGGVVGFIWSELTKDLPDKAECAYNSRPANLIEGYGVCLWSEEDQKCNGSEHKPSNKNALCFNDGDWQDTIKRILDIKANRTINVKGESRPRMPSWAKYKIQEIENDIGSMESCEEFEKPCRSVNLQDLLDIQTEKGFSPVGILSSDTWTKLGKLREKQWYILYVEEAMKYEQEIINWLQWWQNETNKDKTPPTLSTNAKLYWQGTLRNFFGSFRSQDVLDYLTGKKAKIDPLKQKRFLLGMIHEFECQGKTETECQPLIDEVENWGKERVMGQMSSEMDNRMKKIWQNYNKDGQVEAWLKVLTTMWERTLEYNHNWQPKEWPNDIRAKYEKNKWDWLIDGSEKTPVFIGIVPKTLWVSFPTIGSKNQKKFEKGEIEQSNWIEALAEYEKALERSNKFKIKYKEEAEKMVDLEAEEQLLEDYKKLNSTNETDKYIDDIEKSIKRCKAYRDDKEIDREDL